MDFDLKMRGEFKQGICGCLEHVDSCLCAFCCPCIEIGYIAQNVGESFILCCCLDLFIPWVPITFLRQKVREKRNIDGSLAEDCLMSWCCTCCAIAQAGAELDIRIIR
ncbi:Protein PLANT CADMIUM RESISTANCE 1 [Thelohanellus kitauei]|uniref:Protein PLANT CADMIUM RESISTANCE 1 n=1 Tax=Thelohanellus kitauei TaxID=669202 RepID=A0A0C2MXH3_THEKT|nr:Protein PLANT CADMIUM RESISTANCE 1 [Thelohanellus kitauei]